MLCFVVLSFYTHTSLPWKLRSDTGLHMRAHVKIMFFLAGVGGMGHYEFSFRRVRPLRKTNLHH